MEPGRPHWREHSIDEGRQKDTSKLGLAPSTELMALGEFSLRECNHSIIERNVCPLLIVNPMEEKEGEKYL